MSIPLKRVIPLASLALAMLLGGCAAYPDGTPVYGNGYDPGYSGYGDVDGGPAYYGAPPAQSNVYLGFGGYSGPSYPDRDPWWGRPGYRGRPDDNGHRGPDRSGWRPDHGGWRGPGGNPPQANAPGGGRPSGPPQQAPGGGNNWNRGNGGDRGHGGDWGNRGGSRGGDRGAASNDDQSHGGRH